MNILKKINRTFVPVLIVLIIILGFILYLENLAETYSDKAQIVLISSNVNGTDVDINSDDEILTRTQWYLEFEEDLLFKQAINYYKKRKFKKAIAAFQRLMNNHLDHPYLYFYIALSQYRRDNQTEALALFNKVKQLAPNFPSVYVYQALIYRKRKEYKQAKKLLRESLSIYKQYSFAKYHLGVLFNEMNMPDSANTTLNAALLISPTRSKPFVYNEIGVSHFKQLEYTEAKEAFLEAIRYKPDYLEPRLNISYLYDDTPEGRKQKIDVLQEILDIRENYVPALSELGMVYFKMGDMAKAHSYFTGASEINPMYTKARTGLAMVELELGQIDRAGIIMSSVVSEDSLVPENYFYLAKTHAEKRDYITALDLYQRTLDLSNNNYPEAWLNMGVIHEKQNNLEQAIICYNNALKLKPEYSTANYNLGLIYKDMKDEDNAIHHYRKAIDNYKACFNLAYLYSQAGKQDSAIYYYQKSIILHPMYTKAKINLALVYTSAGQLDKAKNIYLTIIKTNPTNSDALFNLARILSMEKKWEESAERYMSLLQINPDNIKAHLNLGVVYTRLGMDDRAIAVYKQGLELDPANEKIRFNLALRYKSLSRTAESIDQFEKVIRLNPQNLKTLNNLSGIYQESKKYTQAAETMILIANIETPSRSNSYDIAKLFYRGKDYQQASEWFEKSAESGYKKSWSYYWAGKSWHQSKNSDKAIQFYLKTLDEDDKHFYAWKQMGLAFLALGDKQTAENNLRIALKIKPENESIIELLNNL